MLKEEESFFARIVHQNSGIVLGDDKGYLVESRLAPLARDLGHKSLRELYDAVKLSLSPDLRQRVIEALTTNETLFFRDIAPFKLLQQELIARYRKTPGRPVRIWCAAASTGQEPYSVAMSFVESWPDISKNDLQIIASDINTQVIDRAQKGVYTQIEVNRGLPILMLTKYFQQNGTHWIISSKLRDFITWRIVNLTQPLSVPGPFDLIFCRNVLIYFNLELKRQILEKMSRLLKPDGILFLGSTETVLGITDVVQSKTSSAGGIYYQLPDKNASK
jgi:chemotaxis protein methyltransferase CheR